MESFMGLCHNSNYFINSFENDTYLYQPILNDYVIKLIKFLRISKQSLAKIKLPLKAITVWLFRRRYKLQRPLRQFGDI